MLVEKASNQTLLLSTNSVQTAWAEARYPDQDTSTAQGQAIVKMSEAGVGWQLCGWYVSSEKTVDQSRVYQNYQWRVSFSKALFCIMQKRAFSPSPPIHLLPALHKTPLRISFVIKCFTDTL